MENFKFEDDELVQEALAEFQLLAPDRQKLFLKYLEGLASQAKNRAISVNNVKQ